MGFMGTMTKHVSRHVPENGPGSGTSAWEIFSMTPGKSPRPNVLVVDDEALIRWSLAESLTNAGYHVLEAHDRTGALRFFERVPPGIAAVVLDLRLPDSQDLGLLRRIREASPDCRVIVMTAYGTPELVEEALKVGAVGVVDKPFDLDRMVDLIRTSIDQRPH
jgi:two-component system NtrC family response regulator